MLALALFDHDRSSFMRSAGSLHGGCSSVPHERYDARSEMTVPEKLSGGCSQERIACGAG